MTTYKSQITMIVILMGVYIEVMNPPNNILVDWSHDEYKCFLSLPLLLHGACCVGMDHKQSNTLCLISSNSFYNFKISTHLMCYLHIGCEIWSMETYKSQTFETLMPL
jgi:hypothetical protein